MTNPYRCCQCATHETGVRITQTYVSEGVYVPDGKGGWWARSIDPLALSPMTTLVLCRTCELPLDSARIIALGIFPEPEGEEGEEAHEARLYEELDALVND